MSFVLRVEIEAEEDITAAVKWYSLRDPDLGERFLSDVDECLAYILREPLSAALISKYHRQFALRVFPFNVVYTVIDDLILVERVYHMKRDPARKLPYRKRKA